MRQETEWVVEKQILIVFENNAVFSFRMPTRRSHESEPAPIKASWDWYSLYIYLGCRMLGICAETSPLSPEKEGRDSFYFINDALERCSFRRADSWSASLRNFPSFMETKSLLSCSKEPSQDPIIGQMSPLDNLFHPFVFVISGFPAKTYFTSPTLSRPSISPWVGHLNNTLACNFMTLPVPRPVMYNFFLSKGQIAKLLSICCSST
jgi:hypothetical protein